MKIVLTAVLLLAATTFALENTGPTGTHLERHPGVSINTQAVAATDVSVVNNVVAALSESRLALGPTTLDVVCDNGKVTLRGYVPSLDVATHIHDVVLRVPGVRAVDNQLEAQALTTR